MKPVIKFICLWILTWLEVANGQSVDIVCSYIFIGSQYMCSFYGLEVPNNEQYHVTISGDHMHGFSDYNVQRLQVWSSNVSFVLPQFFTKFPNVEVFDIRSSGLERIQSNAFMNAGNLRIVSMIDDLEFIAIYPNAFLGATKLETISLNDNNIQFIHESAFNGLTSLKFLYLQNNKISYLPTNVFSSLISLDTLDLSRNFLTTLDERLLSNNFRLFTLSIESNQISSIGRNFFSNLFELLFLNLSGNECVNDSWVVDVASSNEIRQSLFPCYNYPKTSFHGYNHEIYS
ncbi:CLUMA_CG015285, isoform A [Clunio marinus]|uniref:CLUMA_CG015285, isoform A n=1 Tax=Clunio marinus TaxID=568069 RepID=A0A1J1IPE8_9DIPT|nr:CLUMA_CG015285, isoform A [Clunio marinus]